MNTIQLSNTTYQWLQNKAEEKAQSPDQLADELLRQQLLPKHAYIEVIEKLTGSQAVIKNTRIPVSIIIGYLRTGITPEQLVGEILPHLNLAQIYDALSYYHDHKVAIDKEIAENSLEYGQSYLKERLGDEGYRRITGQTK